MRIMEPTGRHQGILVPGEESAVEAKAAECGADYFYSSKFNYGVVFTDGPDSTFHTWLSPL